MLQATKDIRKVALWLGHAYIHTTEIYLQSCETRQSDQVQSDRVLLLRVNQVQAL
jgi:integrase/recombinase XerD